MKIQIAYKATGEIPEELFESMERLAIALEDTGHNVYLPLREYFKKGIAEDIILQETLKKIKENDILLAVIKSENKSEGMLIELGYALAHNKKIIVAIKEDIKDTRTRHIADEIIEFSDIDDLCEKLKQLK